MYTFNVWETQDENSWFSCIPGKNGFLPIDSPLCRLPDEYNIINDILDNMKINKSNGELGYLDNIILPEETRGIVYKYLCSLKNKKHYFPNKKHGNIQL